MLSLSEAGKDNSEFSFLAVLKIPPSPQNDRSFLVEFLNDLFLKTHG